MKTARRRVAIERPTGIAFAADTIAAQVWTAACTYPRNVPDLDPRHRSTWLLAATRLHGIIE